jgi:hypothetical protein
LRGRRGDSGRSGEVRDQRGHARFDGRHRQSGPDEHRARGERFGFRQFTGGYLCLAVDLLKASFRTRGIAEKHDAFGTKDLWGQVTQEREESVGVDRRRQLDEVGGKVRRVSVGDGIGRRNQPERGRSP